MANLSDDLERFIQQEIRSIEQLEVLLLVNGKRDKWWTEAEVFEVIRSSLPSVRDRLAELNAAGLLERLDVQPLAYRYAPSSPDRTRLIDELAHAYRSHRIAVIDVIYQSQTRRPNSPGRLESQESVRRSRLPAPACFSSV